MLQPPRSFSITSPYGYVAWRTALVALLLLVGMTGYAAPPALAQDGATDGDGMNEERSELGEEDSGGESEELTPEEGGELIRELGYQNTPEECEGARGSQGSVDPDDIDDECLQALQQIQDEELDAGGEESGNQEDSDGEMSELQEDEATEDSDDSGGFLGIDPSNIGRDAFRGILEWMFEGMIEDGADELTQHLNNSAFTLPPPEGPMVETYEGLVETVRPGVVVGLLLMSLAMMLRPANYNVAYATQTALPNLMVVIAGLAFFPQIMTIFSDLTNGIANTMLSQYDMRDALTDVMINSIAAPFSLITIVTNIILTVLIFLVLAISLLKSFLFALLFMVGPLALILYPVPGLSGVTGSWFRAVLACFMIPVLYSVQIGLGVQIIAAPEMVFGENAGTEIYQAFAMLILMWVMWKTPFKVLEWAFYGYRPGSGLVSSVAKGAVVGVAIRGLLGGRGGGSS